MTDVNYLCRKKPSQNFFRILNVPLTPLQYQNILSNTILKTGGLDLTLSRLSQVELPAKKQEELIFLEAYFSKNVLFRYFFRILTCIFGLFSPITSTWLKQYFSLQRVRSNHQRYSLKFLLKTSQSSQENTCAMVSFFKIFQTSF